MNYREFVKENFHKLPASMVATEKMKKIGEMWRASGHSKAKGGSVAGGSVAGGSVAGGAMKHKKASKAKGKGVAGGSTVGGMVVGGMLHSLLGGKKGMRKMPVKGGATVGGKINKSKAMKSAGGAIPWNWEFIDPSRGISEQLQDYFIKGLVGQANPLGKATLAQIKKVGGDEQTLEFNHRYWDAKDESNRLLNAVAVDNQKRADEPSFGEQLATTAVSSLASALPEMMAAGFKKKGKKAKGGSVGGATVGGALSDKDKMKMKKKMHKLEMVSHQKKLTKKQEADLKHLHKQHGEGLL